MGPFAQVKTQVSAAFPTSIIFSALHVYFNINLLCFHETCLGVHRSSYQGGRSGFNSGRGTRDQHLITHARTRAHTHTRARVCACVRACVRVFVCLCERVYGVCIFVRIFVCIHDSFNKQCNNY